MGFNAARGFVGGATTLLQECNSNTYGFQCRTRLCGWCNLGTVALSGTIGVSMPHAALWVVQLVFKRKEGFLMKFQCRTRLCGWCSDQW